MSISRSFPVLDRIYTEYGDTKHQQLTKKNVMIVGFHPMFKHLYLQLGGIDNLLKHHKKHDFSMAAKIKSSHYLQQILSDLKNVIFYRKAQVLSINNS